MKYIRTFRGIHEVIEECFKPMGNNMVFIPNEGFTKILKQADTIEELCDECISVLENGNGSHIWHESDLDEKTPYLFHNARMFKEDDEIVYGAIWTDKGLTYVAKMNDKGELELL